MLSVQQKDRVQGKLRCNECNGLLTQQNLRPRTMVERLRYPDSRLYICRDCGARNLIDHSSAESGAAAKQSSDRLSEAELERRRFIENRLERNTRALIKLRELVRSDRRLLKYLSNRQGRG